MDSTSYFPKGDFSLTAFPLAFYLPETSLAFGALGICVFNPGETKNWRKSQVQLGLAYTLKKQFLLFVPYELYFKQKWKLNGELGYYKYFYNYYGIGPNSKEENLETYDANFPRIITGLSYRVKPTFLLGVQYRLDAFQIPFTDSLLSIDKPIGAEGGIISALGFTASYDSRNDIFYPSEGLFINFTTEFAGNATFSSFDFSLLSIDANYYHRIFKNHILAFNVFAGSSQGDVPFTSYYYLSSGKKGRGFNDRRFIDRNMGLVQLAYRFPIYKRFRGTLFASEGNVGPSFISIFENKPKLAYGAGVRFQMSKKQLSHIRLDVARSYEGFQFYITIGEAF
ncbi:BamA/TamA family outer membrane protein [Putridiphycobacter roseus]|uniref:BamA/TamA family outer membrane protein n=1 Tax=Putridiphycobacter roseus TaxID=2219161 RepID=UPI0013145532|nr:BamA/TamA family outer membrane protein [Putridiphycobacter roseus]